jgi:hypothetical protein
MSSRPAYLLNALLSHGEVTDALPQRLTFYMVGAEPVVTPRAITKEAA